MRLEIVTPPATEPVTLAEAKSHCRIEHDADDTLLSSQIVAARIYAEKYMGRAIISQSWKMSLDSCDYKSRRPIDLRISTVQSITSVKSFASDNSEEVFSSSNYRKSGDRIVLNDGSSWPFAAREFDALEIVFVAGFGDASSVPEPIKQAMKMLVAHWYETREASGDAVMADSKAGEEQQIIPFGVQQILFPYRIFAI